MPLAPLSTELFAVVPVLTGPLQVLLALLPALLAALGALLLSMFRPRAMFTALKLLWRLKLSLCLVLLIAVGLVTGLKSHFARSSTSGPPIADPAASHDWPVARGNLSRTGATPGAQGPTRGGVNWTWQDRSAAVFSSPAVVGDRVYFTSSTLSLLGGGSGVLRCLDAHSGRELWSFAPPGYRATFSSPVIAGDYLVTGEGLHFVRDARVICIDLRQGKLAWTYATASHVECTPFVHKGRVYVGAGDDGYYCFELEPGPDGRARLVWHVPGENYPDAETSLAVAEDSQGRSYVFAGLGVGGQALCVLDADTGQELRRVPTAYPVFGPPTIVDGLLYVGMGNGDYVRTAAELGQPPGGAVWCLDVEKLVSPSLTNAEEAVVWKSHQRDTVLGSVAISGDEGFYCSHNGMVTAFNVRTGRSYAWAHAGGTIVTSPAVTGRHVYVLTDAGVIHALRRTDLHPDWVAKVASGPLLISSPVVAHGRVYLGSEHDGLICAGEPGRKEVPIWPSASGGPGVGGNPDNEPLPSRGAFQWQYPTEQMGQSQEAVVAAPVAMCEGTLYVPLAGSELRGVAALRVGDQGDEAPPPAWLYRTPNPVWLSLAATPSHVAIVDGRVGDPGRQLHVLHPQAINSKTPAEAWLAPVAGDATGIFAMDRQWLVVQDQAKSLGCFKLDSFGGGVKWRQTLGVIEHSPAFADQMLVVAVTNPAMLAALDLPTGALLWQARLDAVPTTSLVVERDLIYVGTTSGLVAQHAVDGRARSDWPRDLPAVASELVLRSDWIAYVSEAAELVVVDRKTGEILRCLAGATPGIAPTTSQDQLIYAGAAALWKASPVNDTPPMPWVETDWLGPPTSSPVVHDGRLYMGRHGWGLVRFGAAQ